MRQPLLDLLVGWGALWPMTVSLTNGLPNRRRQPLTGRYSDLLRIEAGHGRRARAFEGIELDPSEVLQQQAGVELVYAHVAHRPTSEPSLRNLLVGKQSHLPVTLTRGTVQIQGASMDYDNLSRIAQFKGSVKATFGPGGPRR
eukprot:gene793-1070_t